MKFFWSSTSKFLDERNNTNFEKKKNRRLLTTKRPVEEIGLIPRSIIRTFSRFIKQMFLGTTDLVVQEFRISRYQVLVSIQCLLVLIFVPLMANFCATTLIFKPLTEYFWNTNQNEIFLNSYQQNRAFLEMQEFEDQLYFDILLNSWPEKNNEEFFVKEKEIPIWNTFEPVSHLNQKPNFLISTSEFLNNSTLNAFDCGEVLKNKEFEFEGSNQIDHVQNCACTTVLCTGVTSCDPHTHAESILFDCVKSSAFDAAAIPLDCWDNDQVSKAETFDRVQKDVVHARVQNSVLHMCAELGSALQQRFAHEANEISIQRIETLNNKNTKLANQQSKTQLNTFFDQNQTSVKCMSHSDAKSFTNLYELENFYLAQLNTQEFNKKMQQKTLELAFNYNQQSINALNHLFGDLITFLTIFLLFLLMKPQILILKSFLLESLYSLSDTTKSFLLILSTDLLVGFHSPRGWEVFIDFIFNRFGFPHNENFIFLFVATFPVLLDTVFKYWIFRYLNKISPSTVATYHAMIE